MVAIALSARAKRGGVGTRARFGQAVTAEVLHRGKLWQITVAQFIVGKGVDHPRGHVVNGDVGGRGWIRGGKLLEDDRRIQPRERRASDVVAHIDTRKTLFGGLA